MKKNKETLQKRKDFVNLACRDKKKAAELLRLKADALENCRNIDDIVFGVSDILFISRSTVWNDYG